jgi:hypothetical protein
MKHKIIWLIPLLAFIIFLHAKDRQKNVPIEDIIYPKISLAKNYPIHDSKQYAGDWFWMDNERIIFWTYEENKKGKDAINGVLSKFLGTKLSDKYGVHSKLNEVIKIWNIDKNQFSMYKEGRVFCYDGQTVRTMTFDDNNRSKSTIWLGLLGQEKEVQIDYKHSIPGIRYGEDCDKFNIATEKEKSYRTAHPDEILSTLRHDHGFLVMGTRDKRIGLLPQDYITYYPNDAKPIKLKLLNNTEGTRIEYIPFVNGYLFVSGKAASGKKSTFKSWTINANPIPEDYVPAIYFLSPNGELTKIPIPDFFRSNYGISGSALSKNGILWYASAFQGDTPGLYLSHDQTMTKLTNDSIIGGKISPDGCRFAYVNQEGGEATLNGRLKVIDLCKGGNE